MRIRYRAHNAADCQTVEIVVYKYKNAQRESGKQRAASCLDGTCCPAAVCRRAACLIHQGNQYAQHNEEYKDTNIPRNLCCHAAVRRVCKDGQERIFDVKIGVEQAAYHDADKQRGIYLLCNQREDNRDQRGYQRPACRIHPAALRCRIRFARERSHAHSQRDNNANENRAQPCISFFGSHSLPFSFQNK